MQVSCEFTAGEVFTAVPQEPPQFVARIIGWTLSFWAR
jgi:hypothetical protein